MYTNSTDTSYFKASARAFLIDAASTDDHRPRSGLRGQETRGSGGSSKPEDVLETGNMSPGDREGQIEVGVATFMSANPSVACSNSVASSPSLAMPLSAQEQGLKTICHAINTSVTDQVSYDVCAGIPYSVDPVITFRASQDHNTSLRLLVQVFLEGFMARSSRKFIRHSKSDAEFAYVLLSLPSSGSILKGYSDAYRSKSTSKLPVEVQTIVTEVLCQLPPLPSGESALAMSTLRGTIGAPSYFTCCLPRLRGGERACTSGTVRLPGSSKSALQYIGQYSNLKAMYSKIMHMLRGDFSKFVYHDTLAALGLFILIMACYEYYRNGYDHYANAVRQSRKQARESHKALMRSFQVELPIASTTSSRYTAEPVRSAAHSGSVPRLRASPRPLSKDIHDAYARLQGQDNQKSGEEAALWRCARGPAFSSRTFAGPFGRSEQDVLNRLSRLEHAGRLDAGSSTIGRSVYRYALDIIRKSPTKTAWPSEYSCSSLNLSSLPDRRQVKRVDVQACFPQKCAVESVEILVESPSSEDHGSRHSIGVDEQYTGAPEVMDHRH